MNTIPSLEEQNQILASWRGARAKIWLFHITHRKLTFCLSRPKGHQVVYVVASGCRMVKGPFSWDSADITIEREASDQLKARYIIVDRSANFELICEGVSVLEGKAFVPINPYRGFPSRPPSKLS
jgi:hypothetical protein